VSFSFQLITLEATLPIAREQSNQAPDQVSPCQCLENDLVQLSYSLGTRMFPQRALPAGADDGFSLTVVL
jgi:hypothetical protein